MLRKSVAVTVAVAASLGLALAVVPAQAGSTKTVSVKNNSFSPTSLKINKGTKVVWIWTQGGVPHDVTPANGKPGSATSSKKGYRFTKTFKKAGTFAYICTVHPAAMKMTVKVN